METFATETKIQKLLEDIVLKEVGRLQSELNAGDLYGFEQGLMKAIRALYNKVAETMIEKSVEDRPRNTFDKLPIQTIACPYGFGARA